MKTVIKHDIIINAIREKLPANTNIANFLINMLHLSKEAVYRRLRGEVPFTLDEVAVMAQTLGISVDNILLGISPKSRPFQLKLTEYINSTEADYHQMEEYLEILSYSRNDPDTEMGVSANMFSQNLYFEYDSFTKYYMFKWLYQTGGIENIRSLEEIEIPDRLRKLQKAYVKECMYIKNTFYIWDYLIFQYLINDIKSFERINYISSADVAALKKELLAFIDKLEQLAAKGTLETGNKVQFYLSSINLETAYSYVETKHLNLSLVNVFTMNSVASLDLSTFIRLKKWMESLKRLSTLISESGEMQRVRFFKKQRELIRDM